MGEKEIILTFIDLGIDQDLAEALAEKGITAPFPIQEQAIPVALRGQDLIGQAKTGTGKTLGFGLPLLQRIGLEADTVRGLIIVPTRELAIQVAEDLIQAAKNRPIKFATIYGGKAYSGQIEDLKAGAQVVIGTPGRLIDLMQQRILNLSHVSELVLDEADRMLDLGFLSDIEKLVDRLPAVRHTMLFSATMPAPIVALARRFMTKPLHIRVSDPEACVTQANIEHHIFRTHNMDKDEVIARILQAEGREKVVIFTKTKRAASRLSEELIDRGFKIASVHGDMNQEARERSMNSFRSGKRDVLVATEVAARGIDVDDVTHVINHTIPEDAESYLHRVGRTGRAGNTGIAVTMVDWDDLHRWKLINSTLELSTEEPVETYSSSPHLYEALNIPEGTKGRILRTPKTRTDEAPRSSASENKNRRSRTRTRKRVQ